MTATLPVERESLGKTPSDLLPGHYGSTSSMILVPISTFMTDCNIHSRGCWGFFVVRTAYGDGIDDERIAAAMGRLEDAVENIITDWRQDNKQWRDYEEIDNEARSRYHSVLLQDNALAGATVALARRYFQEWARPWATVDPDNNEKLMRSPRFMAFVLLDEQVLANLETFPARGDMEAFLQCYLEPTTEWIKLVDTDNEDPSDGQIAVAACDLANVFRNLAFEEHGLETFPRSGECADAEKEWEFYDG